VVLVSWIPILGYVASLYGLYWYETTTVRAAVVIVAAVTPYLLLNRPGLLRGTEG